MSSINNVSSSSNLINDIYSKYGLSTTTTTTSTTSTSATTTTSDTTTSATTTTSDTSTKGTTNTSVKRYINSTSSDDLSAKTIFKELSIDMGGDGSSITEDQLNSYISSAESGKISIGDNELNALKSIQSNWSTLSLGSDSISYSNMNGSKDTLLSIAGDSTQSTTTSSVNLTESSTDKVYSYLIESALGTSTSSTSSSSDSSVKSLLNTLLSGTTDENDDANSELISQLTNLLSKSTYTIELQG